MTNSIIYIIFLFLLLVVAISNTIIVYKKNITIPNINKNMKIRTLDELLSILNYTIEQEIMFRLKIEYEIKRNNKIITDFSGEYRLLTKNVVDAFSYEYFAELRYYYNEEFILKYIAKNVEIYIIKYIDENKIRTR